MAPIDAMTAAVCDGSQWPLFRVRLLSLTTERALVGVGIQYRGEQASREGMLGVV